MKTHDDARLAITFTADAWESFYETVKHMSESHPYYVEVLIGEKKIGGVIDKMDPEGLYLSKFYEDETQENWPYPEEVEIVKLLWGALTEVHIP